MSRNYRCDICGNPLSEDWECCDECGAILCDDCIRYTKDMDFRIDNPLCPHCVEEREKE